MDDIWVRTCDTHEEAEEADREFWADMSPDERVEALEEMRLEQKVTGREHIGRLRRVVRVFERT